MVDLSIVIISFNTKKILQECLESIRNSISKDIAYEVIIVDNASTDGTIEEISNKSRYYKIIKNKDNLGFSKANNIGIKNAKGRYILFLNSDTVVYPKTIETLIDFMDEHKNSGAATCRVELANGTLDDASHRGFPTPWNSFCYFSGISRLFPNVKLLNGYTLNWMDFSKTHEIDALAGAFMLVRKEAGEEVGWWDEDYFFYGEDLDFCYRLKQKGWKIFFVPIVKILHYKGVSGGLKETSQHLTTADNKTRLQATNARFNAMKIFYQKHYQDKYPKILTWLVLQGIEFKKKITLGKYQ